MVTQGEKPDTQVRLYLNPPREVLPKLATAFIQQADQNNVPFYFKLIDFSLQKPTLDDLNRMDRMVFYTDKNNIAGVAEILKNIQKQHPDWFADRPLPALTAQITEGVSFAEEPSDFQNKTFSERGETRTSFNDVRSKFMLDVWQSTTSDILSKYPDSRPRGGRTMREIFNEKIPSGDKVYIEQIWKSGLNPELPDAKGRRVLEDALLRTMVDIMPNIRPDSLLSYVQNQMKLKADKYQIDPNNLALNSVQ